MPAEIRFAAKYYQEKYNRTPNCCHVHPSQFCECKIEGMTVVADKNIRPMHLWIGQEVKESAS
jgi:hypothetical protein